MQDQDQLRPLAELDDYELRNGDQDIRGAMLLGEDGQPLGTIRDLLVDRDEERVAAVRLDSGAVHRVENLERRGEAVLLREPDAAVAAGSGSSEEERIPIVQEQMLVGKLSVARGGVEVRSRIVEEPVREDVTLRQEHLSVERQPLGRARGAPVTDDAFRERTVSMTERSEEAVVTKSAQIVEEVVVRKDVEQRVEQVNETLRHTEVDVIQQPATGAKADSI